MRRLVAALLVATGLGAATEAAPLYFAGEAAGVGDPNPFFENGTYSVFYLQSQGRHPWFMSQTSDLRTWSAPVEAVPAGEAGTPDYWTGSGSVVAAPSLPADLGAQFDMERTTLSTEDLEVGTPDSALRVRAETKVAPGARFGVAFTATNSGRVSTIEIDTSKGEAIFLYNGDRNGAPRVAFPSSADGVYALDLVVDPELGLGVLYINDFRALSFRYYRVGATTISLFADDGLSALDGTVSVRSTDQTEEKPNG